MSYADLIREKAIQDFIRDKKRSPSEEELRDLLLRERKKYADVKLVGLAGYELDKASFREAASAEVENSNRTILVKDYQTISGRLDDLSVQLDQSYAGFRRTVKLTSKLLNQLEARLDNLLLLNSNIDVFLYGIEETFESHDLLLLEESTATVENGVVTLGRDKLAVVDLTSAVIKSSITANIPLIGTSLPTNTSNLIRLDGSVWNAYAYTGKQSGRVSLLIEIDLPGPTYINDIQLTLSPISLNQLTTATIFYSTNGSTFSSIEPAEKPLTKDYNTFNIGVSNVRKLQILLSKNTADNTTFVQNQYVYLFSIDNITLTGTSYSTSKESVLIAGPYEFTNEFGEPVYFTKATLKACVSEPDNTGVSFFLSQDKTNWKAVDWREEGATIVSFQNSQVTSDTYYDVNTGATALISELDLSLEEILNTSYEALLNKGIASQYTSKVPRRSILIKRNIPTSSTVFGQPSGWFYDKATDTYITTVAIDNPNGLLIDFGPKEVMINDMPLSGNVTLPEGTSVIRVSSESWKEIEAGASSLEELKAIDPLYPYNHKYLIEGYTYSPAYNGPKVYTGVDEYFGFRLKYLPPEKFDTLDHTSLESLEYYTIVNINNNFYFKVITDKTDSSWSQEEFSATWTVQSNKTNQLYVKAILSTSDLTKTPTIEDFSVRVI